MSISIKPVDTANFDQILPLIGEYQRFYGCEPNSERNATHFGAMLTDPSRGQQLIAVADDGAVVGFATLYFTLSSLQARKACVLNDLHVTESHRRRGIARQLIEHALRVAKDNGFLEMEWMTHTSNTGAQKLYDGMGATRSSWYEYSIGVDHGEPAAISTKGEPS